MAGEALGGDVAAVALHHDVGVEGDREVDVGLAAVDGPGVRARAAHGQRRAAHARVHRRLAPQPLQLLADHDPLRLGALEVHLSGPRAHDDALDVAIDGGRRRAIVLERLADAHRDSAHHEQDAEDEQHKSGRRESHRL
jgi:hypothetical protein